MKKVFGPGNRKFPFPEKRQNVILSSSFSPPLSYFSTRNKFLINLYLLCFSMSDIMLGAVGKVKKVLGKINIDSGPQEAYSLV